MRMRWSEWNKPKRQRSAAPCKTIQDGSQHADIILAAVCHGAEQEDHFPLQILLILLQQPSPFIAKGQANSQATSAYKRAVPLQKSPHENQPRLYVLTVSGNCLSYVIIHVVCQETQRLLWDGKKSSMVTFSSGQSEALGNTSSLLSSFY